ncbi:MAG: hypothetical protein H6Q15_155 [Bacteroidetes bacterium]|nr:hypothetical protein [Bacteroidota bacterium]
MKKIFITLFILAISVNSFAQSFELPKNFKMETPQQSEKYDDLILPAIEWIMMTPPNIQERKQLETKKFLLEWSAQTEKVSVSIGTNVAKLYEKNEDLILIYVLGCVKYVLETNDNLDKEKINLSGFELAIDYYTKNKKLLKKDKNLEDLIKKRDNGTLKEYIKEKI